MSTDDAFQPAHQSSPIAPHAISEDGPIAGAIEHHDSSGAIERLESRLRALKRASRESLDHLQRTSQLEIDSLKEQLRQAQHDHDRDRIALEVRISQLQETVEEQYRESEFKRNQIRQYEERADIQQQLVAVKQDALRSLEGQLAELRSASTIALDDAVQAHNVQVEQLKQELMLATGHRREDHADYDNQVSQLTAEIARLKALLAKQRADGDARVIEAQRQRQEALQRFIQFESHLRSQTESEGATIEHLRSRVAFHQVEHDRVERELARRTGLFAAVLDRIHGEMRRLIEQAKDLQYNYEFITAQHSNLATILHELSNRDDTAWRRPRR
jgi:chromosome segregation ATPase